MAQEKNAAPAGCTRMQEANGALLSRGKREDHRADERSRREERARGRLVVEQIGESLLDPRNGSCPSKKERSGAGVAAAWQLPPTWDSPRSRLCLFRSPCCYYYCCCCCCCCCCYCCCIGLVVCRHYRSRGTVVHVRYVRGKTCLRKPCNSAATWLMLLPGTSLTLLTHGNFCLTSEITRDRIA